MLGTGLALGCRGLFERDIHMNAGPVEEVGATSRELIHSLSSSPVILFLLVFILVFLGLFAWAARDTRQHYDALYNALLANQAKLLANCHDGGTHL